MKVEVKKIDSTKRVLEISVGQETVQEKFEEIFKKIAKDAKVPGFRPGHVPRDILEKHYSGLAHEQVLKELVPDIYNRAIEAEKLDVIEIPEITDVKLNRQSLSFKATVEVNPEIQVKDYKGINVRYKKISVSEDEVNKHLDSIKEARKIDTIDDNFSRSLCYPNLDELKRALERQIFIEKENAERRRIEKEIIESLTKKIDFKLPQSLIDRQLAELVRQAKIDLALKGVAKEKLDEEEKNLSKELESEARRQVKVYLVLAEIAKRENIPLDDRMTSRVMEFLLREANWQTELTDTEVSNE
jgi:FKBP-type peptidyl-prolyl cis-trans isomerase (trigger factor)